MKFLQRIGALAFAFLATVGRISSFTATALSHAVRPPFYPRIIGQQMIEIGSFSLPVVGLTAVFAGMNLPFRVSPDFPSMLKARSQTLS